MPQDLVQHSVQSPSVVEQENAYAHIRHCILDARSSVNKAVNMAMVYAYWDIGAQVHALCGAQERAAYGKKVLQELSAKLTAEFGKGFIVRNLQTMRQFYLTFPIRHTLCSQLSWSHYRLLLRVQNSQAREFYASECVLAAWSVRQLERQITTFYYERILASKLCNSLLHNFHESLVLQ